MTPAKSGRAGLGAGEAFVEMVEKEQLPDFRFFGRSGIGAWRSNKTCWRRKSTTTIHFGGSKVDEL
jgi:hypothetical protein